MPAKPEITMSVTASDIRLHQKQFAHFSRLLLMSNRIMSQWRTLQRLKHDSSHFINISSDDHLHHLSLYCAFVGEAIKMIRHLAKAGIFLIPTENNPQMDAFSPRALTDTRACFDRVVSQQDDPDIKLALRIRDKACFHADLDIANDLINRNDLPEKVGLITTCEDDMQTRHHPIGLLLIIQTIHTTSGHHETPDLLQASKPALDLGLDIVNLIDYLVVDYCERNQLAQCE